MSCGHHFKGYSPVAAATVADVLDTQWWMREMGETPSRATNNVKASAKFLAISGAKASFHRRRHAWAHRAWYEPRIRLQKSNESLHHPAAWCNVYIYVPAICLPNG